MNQKALIASIKADIYKELAIEGLRAGYKHDLDSGFTTTTNFMHGPSGIFGQVGLERDVFSSRVTPRGLLEVLPAMPTMDTNPIVPYLTGLTASSGSEPDTPCETCVQAGELKSCYQGAAFGLVCRQTDELNIADVGKNVNRGEFRDLRMVNDPLLSAPSTWVPGSIPRSVSDILNREALARWYTLGVEFENTLAELVFTGNPANNVGTGYAEYHGLEQLVTTGHTDVLTATSCPSLDSKVVDMNYASLENDAADIFAQVETIYRFLKHNALTMKFLPVQWVIVMKDSLFRKLSDYWPCVYDSFRCNATANDITNNVDAAEQRRRSDQFYNERFLLIDGERVPVIVDDAIPYEKNGDAGSVLPSGTFASDIYIIPMTVNGGRMVTYMEYFNYSGSFGPMQAAMDGRLTNSFWTDGGIFLWTFRRTDFCVQWKARIEPRLRLLTPHLAARIQNVQWTPLHMFREPFNSQGYFVDGGETSRSNGLYSYSQ